MGVSNRATHAIEPRTGDLLMPVRNLGPHATLTRDIEDARFEAVAVPRDVFSTRPEGHASSDVFKSRISNPQADGPIPRDFADTDRALRRFTARSERLGVFAGPRSAFTAGGLRSGLAAFTIGLAVCAVAGALALTAGGLAFTERSGDPMQATAAAAPLVSITDRAVLLPDPVVTFSVPVKKTKASSGGFTSPIPRPARIERAGSILMIRPAGG